MSHHHSNIVDSLPSVSTSLGIVQHAAPGTAFTAVYGQTPPTLGTGALYRPPPPPPPTADGLPIAESVSARLGRSRPPGWSRRRLRRGARPVGRRTRGRLQPPRELDGRSVRMQADQARQQCSKPATKPIKTAQSAITRRPLHAPGYPTLEKPYQLQIPPVSVRIDFNSYTESVHSYNFVLRQRM